MLNTIPPWYLLNKSLVIILYGRKHRKQFPFNIRKDLLYISPDPEWKLKMLKLFLDFTVYCIYSTDTNIITVSECLGKDYKPIYCGECKSSNTDYTSLDVRHTNSMDIPR